MFLYFRLMSAPSPHIALVGTGSMSIVMAQLLASKGRPVTVLGRDPAHVAQLEATRRSPHLKEVAVAPGVKFTARPEEAFAGAALVVSAVPTQYLRGMWGPLARHLRLALPEAGIASFSKGLENGTLLRPTQVIAEAADAGGRPLAVVSGPTVADELAKALPATVCAASADAVFAKHLQDTFNTQWFRVYTHDDVVGVEIAGALKNCIALAAGVLDGLQAGNNAKSALFARGIAEIARLGVAMGARQETFFGIAGVGDLATTCFSPTGRNRSCGELLGRDVKLEEALAQLPGVVEGVPTVRAVMALAKKHGVEMPICEQVHRVLFEDVSPREAIGCLMSRAPKAEKVG